MTKVELKDNEFLEVQTDNEGLIRILNDSPLFMQLHPGDDLWQYVAPENLKFPTHEDYIIHILKELS